MRDETARISLQSRFEIIVLMMGSIRSVFLCKSLSSLWSLLLVSLVGCGGFDVSSKKSMSKNLSSQQATPQSNPSPVPDPIASPGPGPVPMASEAFLIPQSSCQKADLLPSRIWRLSHPQYANSISAALGISSKPQIFPPEATPHNFENQKSALRISIGLAKEYFLEAERLAVEVASTIGVQITACAGSGVTSAACLTAVTENYGPKLYRRPLRSEDRTSLTNVFNKLKGSGTTDAIIAVLQTMILSPQFLYRTELGQNPQPGSGLETLMTDHEIANNLSFMLTNSPPDEALMQKAAAGQLKDPAVRQAEATRLLASMAGKRQVKDVVTRWLKINDVETREKDPSAVTGYTKEILVDFRKETDLFLNYILDEKRGSFEEMLSTPYSFVNARLSSIYGAGVSESSHVLTKLNPLERAGILTQGSFMASHSSATATSVVERGQFVRESLFCQIIPPPPADVPEFSDKLTEEQIADMTEKEKWALHSIDPSCKACHQYFDAIGLALENYNPLARFEISRDNKSIDPAGSLELTNDINGPFSSSTELLLRFSKSRQVKQCFARQVFRYSYGQDERPENLCSILNSYTHFENNNSDIRQLFIGTIVSDSFVKRKMR